MQAIEFETRIDETGHICVPEKFHNTYGKLARLVVLISDQIEPQEKSGDQEAPKACWRWCLRTMNI